MGSSRATLSLGQILKLELIEEQSSTRITELWNSFHALNPRLVSKVVPAKQYLVFRKNIAEAPKFIYPLLRKQGHFMLLSSFADNEISFHHSADYSVSPITSDSYFDVSLFDDLLQTKGMLQLGIALYRGEITKDTISKHEAEKLLRGLLSFYLKPKLFAYVTVFNHAPERFRHEDFVRFYLETFA